jgi:hypothetical protein
MEKPYQYTIIYQKTGQKWETNLAPTLRELQTYEPTESPDVFVLKQTKVCYIDTRYQARLRLYNYLMRKNKTQEALKEYEPYANTEIGKSIPILPF